MSEIKYYTTHPQDLRRETRGSSGYDLRARLVVEGRDHEAVSLLDYQEEHGGARWKRTASTLVIEPGGWAMVHCGLWLEMPLGIEAQIRPRSGLARRDGLVTVVGTTDSDYRGIVGATLFNHGLRDFVVEHGDRVAQLVFCPVILPGEIRDANLHVDELRRVTSLDQLSPSERGAGGYGSTGVK